jgi:hypothetical protein
VPCRRPCPAPRQSTRPEGRALAGWAAAIALGLAVVLGAGEVLPEPDTVDLVVGNESSRAITVHVRSDEGGPLLPVATVEPGEVRTVEQVIDQGARWLVTYRAAGRDVGEAEVDGDALAADGYRLRVPATVDGAAGAEGIEPTP